MDYQQTLNWLFSQLPMYQRIGQAAYKANLDNTLLLDKHFNHPHTKFKTIHVAGTNGKGSVSHMIASILQEAGYRTGLYTSPHLKDFRERIKTDGEMISEKYIIDFVENNKELFQQIKPSFFEMTVAMAFKYFEEQAVDIAVIEVGLGGSLDSTNIITPEVSVITNISFDHTALLGETIEKIASEKAGIIKKEIPVIIGTRQPESAEVFEEKATIQQAPIIFASDKWSIKKDHYGLYQLEDVNGLRFNDLSVELKGFYQNKNIPTVLEAILTLKNKDLNISDKNIYDGFASVVKNTGLLGRWQELSYSPYTVCDTGHNIDGITEILKQINSYTFDKLRMVIGVVNDKDIDNILEILPKEAIYYFCKASIPRSLDENTLAQKAHTYNLLGDAYSTVKEAYDAALQDASPDDMIYIGGSTFVVAEII